jgi:hypothetical protein
MRVFRSSRSVAKPDLFGFAYRRGCSPRLFGKIEELTAKNFKDSSVGCLYRSALLAANNAATHCQTANRGRAATGL